jgi:prefoldin alpha subunit
MPEKKKEIKVTGKQLIDTYRSDQAKMDVLQRRQQGLQHILSETILASEALKEIQKAKKDENILVSLGAGLYAEAKIGETKKLKNSLAGSVLVDEETGKALSKLQEEIEKIQKDLAGVQNERQKIVENMQSIAGILQESRKSQMARQSNENNEISSVS